MVRAVYHIHREQPTEASKIYGGVKESHREPQLDRIDTRGARCVWMEPHQQNLAQTDMG
jgi:hypothetical protein